MTKSEKKKKSTKKVAPTAKQVKELETTINDLQQQVLDITKERDDLVSGAEEAKDQTLRSLAELENVKRRKEQEKVDAIKFANERLVTDLLPVLDSFQLAMAQSQQVESDEVKAIVSGFEMIQKQLDQFLEKCGVKRIEAVDQPFDPNLHQGISQEVNPDLDENTIIKEMQPGYTLNDRVLRASMVVVSKK
jgi:molecular chaperone GrpE